MAEKFPSNHEMIRHICGPLNRQLKDLEESASEP
jgi:hypothetical protein